MTNKICIWCGNSLPKRRRKYCSDDCSHKYWEKYIVPLWWNNARNMALARANYACEECGNRGWLEVHHIVPLNPYEARHNSSKNKQDNLKVLCRCCHEKAHHPNAGKAKANEIPKEQLPLNMESSRLNGLINE